MQSRTFHCACRVGQVFPRHPMSYASKASLHEAYESIQCSQILRYFGRYFDAAWDILTHPETLYIIISYHKVVWNHLDTLTRHKPNNTCQNIMIGAVAHCKVARSIAHAKLKSLRSTGSTPRLMHLMRHLNLFSTHWYCNAFQGIALVLHELNLKIWSALLEGASTSDSPWPSWWHVWDNSWDYFLSKLTII